MEEGTSAQAGGPTGGAEAVGTGAEQTRFQPKTDSSALPIGARRRRAPTEGYRGYQASERASALGQEVDP
eukprot:4472314-Lingulodinium_polyedra.AAC.1